MIIDGISKLSEEKIAVMAAHIAQRAEHIVSVCDTDEDKIRAFLRESGG